MCNKNCLPGSSPMMLYLPGFLALSFPPEDPDSEGPLTGTEQSVVVTTASCRLWMAATAPGGTSETRSPLTTCRKMKWAENKLLCWELKEY